MVRIVRKALVPLAAVIAVSLSLSLAWYGTQGLDQASKSEASIGEAGLAAVDSVYGAGLEAVPGDRSATLSPIKRTTAARSVLHLSLPPLDRYRELVAQAEKGDSASAEELAKVFRSCKDVRTSDAEIERAVQIASSGDLADSPRVADRIAEMRGFMRDQRTRCMTLGVNPRTEYRRWLRVASDLGDTTAQLSYVESGAPSVVDSGSRYADDLNDYRQRARQILEEQIRRGNVEALRTAARAYARGTVFGRNPEKEYSYLYAYALATGTSSRTVYEWLAIRRSGLSEDRLLSATKEGEVLYAACCSRGP